MEDLPVSKPSVRFEVEKVIGVSSDGSYQVQWAPAWVSKVHLDGCEHLIQEFLQQQQQQQQQQQHIEEFLQETEKEHKEKLLYVQGESNEIHSKVASTGGIIVEQPQVKIVHTQYSRVNSADNLLSDAITTSIKIEEEEEEEEMFEVVNDSTSLVFVASKENVPLCKENVHGVPVVMGTNSKKHVKAKDGLPSHYGAQNRATFDKSNEIFDLSKDGMDSYCNLSSLIQNKSASLSAFSYIKSNSTYNNSSPTTCGMLDASKEVVTKHPPVAHWMMNEAPVSTEGDPGRKHICTVCQKQFSHKGHLRDHLRVHTGVKPFVCEVCNKAFAQSGNLNQHVRTHSGEKFVCQLCGKSFSRRNTLDKHMQTHINSREFVCNLCHKSFWLEEAFEKHLCLVHSNNVNNTA